MPNGGMSMSTRQRKITVVTLCAVLFALCSSAEAQQPKKVPRIGFLTPNSASDPLTMLRLDVLRQGLRDLAYVEGKNITIEYRYAEEKFERLSELAEEHLLQARICRGRWAYELRREP